MDATALEVFGWGNDLLEVVHFHNLTRQLLGVRYRRLKMDLNETEATELEPSARHTIYLIDNFGKQVQNTTFLMMYSLVEESIARARQFFFPELERSARGGVGRFKHFLAKIGVDLATDCGWCAIREAECLRDCILHANGNLGLCSDSLRARVEQLANLRSPNIRIDRGKLQIDSSYLLQFHDDVIALCRNVGASAAKAAASVA